MPIKRGTSWAGVPVKDEGTGRAVPNMELEGATCMVGDELAPLVLATRGFTRLVEGSELHPKPGYVAQSALEIWWTASEGSVPFRISSAARPRRERCRLDYVYLMLWIQAPD